MSDAIVLVTVQNGTVDYVTQGSSRVVLVNFDEFDEDRTFPEDVDEVIEQVLALPSTIPWRGGVIKRLQQVRAACKKSLHTASTYDEPELPCCDYRDHSSGVCACPEHTLSMLHPFGTPK